MKISATHVFALALSVLSSAASAQDSPKGDAVKGKAAYLAAGCQACHGTAGQGTIAPRLTPPTPYEAFVLQLRQPRDTMIPYPEKLLSNAQAADIHAYLAAIPKPPDPATLKVFQ